MDSAKDNPKEPPEYFFVTKKEAATSQLETSISLWFNYGDPVSIHTLASAADECFHAMSKLAGKPSVLQAWLKTQSNTIKKAATQSQNFFKHGSRDAKGKIPYFPQEAEHKILDAILCYKHLHQGYITPTMGVFEMFYFVRNPQAIPPDLKESLGNAPKGEVMTDRTKFFNTVLPVFIKDDAEFLSQTKLKAVK